MYFVNALRDALIRNGISVLGPAEDLDDTHVVIDRARAVPLAVRESPHLREIAKTMMKVSQNLFAETLLKTMSVQPGPIGSTETGLEAVAGTLTGWGVVANGIHMVDGSGLSRYNLATADALVAVLAHVYHDERLRGPFLDALPIAAVDGTLAERMKDTAASGNARAKTGSFSNARSLAGYVKTSEGEAVAFTILANNYGVPPGIVDRAMDDIVVALARFSRR
jgi:D-alanyl-D-alanine carboxypeptidase/D-alanyl-D-alanine-endopeptidase (penicillin-binding protein 4)